MHSVVVFAFFWSLLPPYSRTKSFTSRWRLAGVVAVSPRRLPRPACPLSLCSQLAAGSPAVDVARLYLPQGVPQSGERIAGLPAWARTLVDPERPVVFVDTDAATGFDEESGEGGVSNPGEAALVGAFLAANVRMGVPVGEVAAITPYRDQAALIGRELEERLGAHAGVAATSMTVDKAQGLDRAVVAIRCGWTKENAVVASARSQAPSLPL